MQENQNDSFTPVTEHPFAGFIRILGKGKKGSRSLTLDEACEAMALILDGKVLPEQLGAFLMLLRVKEETPEELAGFVKAVRSGFAPASPVAVDVDWATYAGKKRHLPWFLLAALVLAEQGVRVFMHGAKGHTQGRIYTEEMLQLFGLSACSDWEQVSVRLDQQHFAFMSIEQMVPKLGEIIQLRPILGLRSPVHTLCRQLNLLGAPVSIDGAFHPAYAPLHQQTANLLEEQAGVTVRGDGGEAEPTPDSDCEINWLHDGEVEVAVWPRLYPRRLTKDEVLDPEDLLRVWRGELEHPYGESAVISTLALVLKVQNPARFETDEAWFDLAKECWQSRDRQRY